MNPGSRLTVAVALLALAACNGGANGDTDRGEQVVAWLPALEPGEVTVLGDFAGTIVPPIQSVAVAPDGRVYVMLIDTDDVWEAVSPSDLDSCCGGEPDIYPGRIEATGDAIYRVHTDSEDPVRGVGAYRGVERESVLTLPVERGQRPGDVAVSEHEDVYLSILAVEEGSVDGVQVLRGTGDGGFEVVAGAGLGCSQEAVPATEARFMSLAGVAVAADGALYAADPRCGSVYAIADGQVRVELGGEDRRPVDVAVVGDDVYVADAGTGEVVRLGDGEMVLSADDVPEGFDPDELTGLDGTPDGDLLVAIGSRLIGVGLADG
ncbi:MAG: hypothetical protein ACRD0A_06930 [Acidimicrobiales bacterium]